MNKKIVVSSLALSAIATLLLTGCTQTTKNDNLITFSEKAPITTVPSWSSSSVSFLLTEGWNVQTIDSEDVATAPKTFYATNKDNTCSITYSSTVDGSDSKNTDEEYLSREKAYLYTDSLNSTETDEAFANIKIFDSKDKLQMLQVSYVAPNTSYVAEASNNIDPESAEYAVENSITPPTYSTNGVINGLSLSRVFDTMVANPFAGQKFKATISNEDEAENNVATKTGKPIIDIKYQCVNTLTDDVFWTKVIENAAISFPVSKL
jgi:hypothetical protein